MTGETDPEMAGSSFPAHLAARIKALEAELAALRQMTYSTELTTVKVPPQFEAPFLQAQQTVARYFAERVERPDTATIAIAGERYVLLRAASLSVEFVEMVMKLYQDKAPSEARSVADNLLFDLAHALGRADARSFRAKMRLADPIENLSAGPVHFAFSGWAFVDISPDSRPSPDEDYYLLYDHPYSFESHSWLAKGRQSEQPVCVMNSGYSSGWCEESFGLPLVAVEVECCAAGGDRCRFIMAPPSRIEAHVAAWRTAHGAPVGTPGERPVAAIPEFFQRKRLEDELRSANELLEERVQKRTQELERVSEQLRHQALHDALTGLPNRVLLHDRLGQGITHLQRPGAEFALLFLDLDGFKEVNDTFGHHTGDLLLTKVGARLRTALRSTDTIARLGGDEFAVVLDGMPDPATAEAGARQLLAALAQPFQVEGHSLSVRGSIGVAHCPTHGTDPVTLMRHADVAMYAAKTTDAGVRGYSPDLDQHSPARLRRIAELREGIEAGALRLLYQPEIELGSGRAVRAEALVRWDAPDGTRLGPQDFLPLIESSELMDRLARWVLDRAVGDCRAWRAAGLPLGVSVNLAPRNLRDAGLPDFVRETLARHDLAPEALTIEITESGILSDLARTVDICQRLRALGVGLSIDDFGTGYSSLSHLKQLPFTELKVDRSFTLGMLHNEHDAAIVRSVIDLGHELGRKVVAEGVETPEVLARLRELDCDGVQGYLFARPVEAGDLPAWFAAHRTPAGR